MASNINIQSIPTLNNIDSANFLNNYVDCNLPLILNEYAGNWPALKKWSREYLKKVAQDTIVEVNMCDFENIRRKTKMTFGKYIDLISNANSPILSLR